MQCYSDGFTNNFKKEKITLHIYNIIIILFDYPSFDFSELVIVKSSKRRIIAEVLNLFSTILMLEIHGSPIFRIY